MSQDEWLKSIDRRLTRIEEKVDAISLREANQSGKIHGATVVLSTIVSIIVSAIAIAYK